jgi:Ion channel
VIDLSQADKGCIAQPSLFAKEQQNCSRALHPTRLHNEFEFKEVIHKMTLNSLFSGPNIAVIFLTGLIVLACVLLHYEVFSLLTRVLTRLQGHIRRRRILLLIIGLLVLHVTEVWLFGIGYFVLMQSSNVGQINGSGGELLDLVYFSAVVYTTLGLGDLVPTGAIRLLTGMEALTGFVLITWSASFTFLEMQRFWKTD